MHEIKNLRMAAALLSMSPLLTMAATPDAGQLLNERQRVEQPASRPSTEPKAETPLSAVGGQQGLRGLPPVEFDAPLHAAPSQAGRELLEPEHTALQQDAPAQVAHVMQGGVAGVEDMVVAPFGEVVGVHGGRR